jgi:hypothetical protein
LAFCFRRRTRRQSGAKERLNRRLRRPPKPFRLTVSRNDRFVDGNQIVLGEIATPEEPTSEAVSPPPVEMSDEEARRLTRASRIKRRIKSLESGSRNEYDEKQKRLLLNLDILSRAESRASPYANSFLKWSKKKRP